MIYKTEETETHWLLWVKPPEESEEPVAVPDEHKEVSYLRASRKGTCRVGIAVIAANKRCLS